MGFGLLFIGYTMMLTNGMEINADLGLGFDVFPDLLGYIFFLLGLRKLRPYSKNFVIAWWLTIPLMSIGAVIFGAELIALFGVWHKPIAILLTYVEYLHYPLLVIFHLYLCMGIKELASEVELPKIVRRSFTAMILTAACYLSQMLLPHAGPAPIMLIAMLLVYITYFYMLYYLYSCYARIVYADEEEKSIPNPLMNLLEKHKKQK